MIRIKRTLGRSVILTICVTVLLLLIFHTWQNGNCGSGARPVNLFIVVISAPSNADARSAIRETWGMAARHTPGVRFAFLLGRPAATLHSAILAEEERYGDIVRGDFRDDYRHLATKSVAMLRWVADHCDGARFLLKIDDDCFLNVSRLLDFLSSRSAEEVAIYGRLLEGIEPQRSNASKWYLSELQYASPEFPPFVAGPSYVYARSAVRAVLDAVAAADESSEFPLEDVYLNGIVAARAGIPRFHCPGFGLEPSEVCGAAPWISVHGLDPQRIRRLWVDFHDENFCKPCSSNWTTFLKKMHRRNIGVPFLNDVFCK